MVNENVLKRGKCRLETEGSESICDHRAVRIRGTEKRCRLREWNCRLKHSIQYNCDSLVREPKKAARLSIKKRTSGNSPSQFLLE